jgi:VCBS repeat-containing protein
VAQVAAPVAGFVGFFNQVVTNLLNPFLAPAPNTPEPFTPIAWAVLGWVRRNLFNQSPTITYDPTTTVQTQQTVTGNFGATDPEGDPLTYRVTQAPQHGTLTIDQATGEFTYTPNDINYTAVQTDTFTVSVTDGKFNVLSLFSPHGDKESIGVDVLNPTVERVILDLPDGYTDPDTPRFAADGKSLYFAVTPPGGTRQEVHQIDVDGTNLRCVTCGLSPHLTANLGRVVPAPDGRIMIQHDATPNSYVVYEPTTNQLVPVITPPAAARVLDPQREMRISPDGKYVVFSQVQLGQTGNFTAVPVVGRLVRTANAVTGAPEYHIEDARVVFPVGEAKQWTPDGKGIIITGGQYEMGNVDDIVVDLATGEVTRLTASLDYDEDIDMSPNLRWIAVGSTRTYDALTPMTRIVRPPFLPAQIQGAVYEAYAGAPSTNVSNQEWLVAIEDELKGENGIPLFVDDDPNTPEDEGDNYNARSMASWNADGTAVAFWEALSAPLGSPDPNVSRLVIANLKYTTSVGPVEGDLVTPHPSWAPRLSESIPTTVALPPVGTYAGAGGGTATITEVPDPTNPGATLRTVTYDNYVNEDGMILNGTESTSATASQNTIRYVGDIAVTGTHTGYLKGDVTINKLTRTITPTITGNNTPDDPGSMIRSSLDGDLLVLLDPDRIAETRTNA